MPPLRIVEVSSIDASRRQLAVLGLDHSSILSKIVAHWIDVTIVAGTDVFGVGLHLRSFTTAALLLWLFALLVWFILIYFSFAVLTFLNTALGANVVHGGWPIAIVGTESLVILGTLIAPAVGDLGRTMFVLIHMLWGVGLGLYGIFIVLFAHRIFFFDVGPDDVTPLPWVVMGAAAISTNAGSTLILTESGMPFLDSMRPFIDGVTLIMWAWATWWIPLLLLFGIWKHGVCRVPLTYTPMFWCLVFPLGMYALVRLGQPPSFACGRLFAVACDILFHGLGCACSLDRDVV